MAEQLIKKTGEGHSNVMPKSWIEAITDKSTGESLTHILQGFNMYFLSYTGNTEQTRCQVPKILRKKGLWITYVKYDGNVYTEWYNSDNIDDKSWGNSSNWRIGNNELVGDLTISANGNWVINGNETEFKAIGEKGNTPLIRIADNKLQVSYDGGDTYNNVSDNPVYTQIRTYNNKLQISTDLGANWIDASDEIAAYFRFNSGQGNNVGNIQISRNNKDWSNLSGNFVNNLHISKYIGADETLPTSGIAEGTIYAKGPTYAESDASHSNPIYRLWVYAYKGNTLAWQDNGEFTSINAGVVQELGTSKTSIISQKGVTDAINAIEEKRKNGNPILENGKYNNIIVGIQSNFVADEFKLTQLYNRETPSDSVASQIIAIEFKINNVIKTCRYTGYKNHISYDNEIVKLEETTDREQYLLVWVRWGGIILNEEVSIPINKFSITYPQEFQLSTFSKNVVEDNIEIVGIYTNFDFKELHLIRFYNRNTNSTSIASQIIEFSGILNDNTPISIEKIEYNNTIHMGLHSYILKYQSYEVGVLVNWKYNHEDAPNKRVFKECINIISSSNSSDNNINGYIDNCYLIPSNDDIIKSNGTFVIDKEGNLIGNRLSTDDTKYVFFNPDIKAIEFDIANLWDSNLIQLAFGYGKDSDSKECACVCYMPTNLRPSDIGFLDNVNSSYSQNASIYGFGHFSGDYRQPQISPSPVQVNSHCRIELSEKGFFEGKIQDSVSKDWKFWFCLDTNGIWTIPNRFGWNIQKCIGFAIKFSVLSNQKMVSNIKIINKKNTYLEKIFNLENSQSSKPNNWICLGDSITAIDDNNGLSYVGFASRKNNLNVVNKGKGGWTIYKYWRDREQVGWEEAIQASKEKDTIVTLLMGTNDFDTKSFTIVDNDVQMDADSNPHPRFGTINATDENAKDPHTTLGCLRLIIERILTLNPRAKLFIFAPFYREKGTVQTNSWLKDLYINADGKTIYDYANAIVSVASEYNIPSFNTAKECGINSLTLSTYTYDDLHLNQYGGELIGNYVAQRIKV